MLRSLQMEGETEVQRSQGWIMFLFLVSVHFIITSAKTVLSRQAFSYRSSTHQSRSSIMPELILPGLISWSNPDHLFCVNCTELGKCKGGGLIDTHTGLQLEQLLKVQREIYEICLFFCYIKSFLALVMEAGTRLWTYSNGL